MSDTPSDPLPQNLESNTPAPPVADPQEPEFVDFLLTLDDADLRTQARGLLESYSHVGDILAEAAQNASDAIDDRRAATPPNGARPWEAKVAVDVDYRSRTIVFTDNGTGMTRPQLRKCASPFVTYKAGAPRAGGRRSRGQKGVGLTFLALSCDRLEIATRAAGVSTVVEIAGGAAWVAGRSADRPRLIELAAPTTPLPAWLATEPSYARVTLEGVSTEEFSEDSLFELKPIDIVDLLRTRTALGHTAPVVLGTVPDPTIDIQARFVGQNEAGEEIAEEPEVQHKFLSPEEYLRPTSVLDVAQVRDLKLKSRVQEAAGRAMVYRAMKQTRSGRNVRAYALVIPPRVFDELTQDLETEGRSEVRLDAGIYVATRGMPTNIVVPAPAKGSGYWRRIFLVLEDDELNFDLGRKTLVGRARPMMQEVAYAFTGV